MNVRREFGDFQTPLPLAEEVVALLDSLSGAPDFVVEPTAGLGSFLQAACKRWGRACICRGYEIDKEYVRRANASLAGSGAAVERQDFFRADWKRILATHAVGRTLILGNPPWVTNAELGALGSANLPPKSNFQGLRGFDARTGKSNFDIAECMLIRLIETMPGHASLGMLCKSATARRVLCHFWKTRGGVCDASLYSIDAKAHFGVSVESCLLFLRGAASSSTTATVHAGLRCRDAVGEFGLVDGQLVSDVSAYLASRDFSGSSPYIWRSGVKHDASRVMEFTLANGCLRNGLGGTVVLEPDYVYPLLKSSDVGNGRVEPRRAVLVTQKNIGDATEPIRDKAPKTWQYLEAHAAALDGRSSSVYRNRPRYSMFGVGVYSFAPWKVAISGMYKSFRFVVVPPASGRPVMLDDTCYFIPCRGREEARLICDLLNSDAATTLLRTLVFEDAKRPVTTDVLRRISLPALAGKEGRLREFAHLAAYAEFTEAKQPQMSLFMGKGDLC